jgi:hypothetical protein
VSWRRLLPAARARLLPGLVALLLAGCSAVQLGYRNADTWMRWQANGYFDFEGVQAEELDRRIAALFAWHRVRALPLYAKMLEESAVRAGRPASRDDLVWGYDAARTHVREALRAAAVEAAPLLDRLEPRQIAHFERKLADDNRKFARDFLEGTRERKLERRLKRNIERLEDWLGSLSDAQVERVKRYNESVPLTEEMRDRDRKRRQAELLAMLRAKAAVKRLPDWTENWDAGRAPDYAAAFERQRAAYFDLLLDLEKTLSPAQREHLVKRLRSIAEDALALSGAAAKADK